MKKKAISLLLRCLNSRYLNATPCRYGFIGNLDAFDINNLRSEVKQRPDITVAQLIAEAELFKACPLNRGLQVMESDGTIHDATVWDVHELSNLGSL